MTTIETITAKLADATINGFDREALENQIAILENGGLAQFEGFATIDGEVLDWDWVDTRYGRKLRVEMPDGEVVWTAALTRNGLRRRGIMRVTYTAAAWSRAYQDTSKNPNGMYIRYCKNAVEVYETTENRLTGEHTEPTNVAEDMEWYC